MCIITVCLRQLRDVDNAAIAFERAASQSDSLSNPLIYLNWAVFSIERGQLAAAYDALSNVMEINRLKPMRKEVSCSPNCIVKILYLHIRHSYLISICEWLFYYNND